MADDVITNPLRERCTLFHDALLQDALFEENLQRVSDILNSKVPVKYFDSVLPGPTIDALLGAIGDINKKFVTIKDLYKLEFKNVKDCRGRVFKSAQKRIRDLLVSIANMTPDALDTWVSQIWHDLATSGTRFLENDADGMIHEAEEYLKFRNSSAYKELENKLAPINNLVERRLIGFLIWSKYKVN